MSGGFIAYNNLAWGTGQLTSNITRITSPKWRSGLPGNGQLLDFATGTLTSVPLTVTGGHFFGDSQAAHGTNPTIGDAFTLLALPDLVWVELETSTMKIDGCLEMLDVAEPAHLWLQVEGGSHETTTVEVGNEGDGCP